jgi:hypothetical protein
MRANINIHALGCCQFFIHIFPPSHIPSQFHSVRILNPCLCLCMRVLDLDPCARGTDRQLHDLKREEKRLASLLDVQRASFSRSSNAAAAEVWGDGV